MESIGWRDLIFNHCISLASSVLRKQNTNSPITNDEFQSGKQDVYSHGLILAKNMFEELEKDHTSKKRGLRSTFWPPKMILNLPYLWKKKTHVVFFVFHLEQLWVLPYECPGLCRHRPGHL